jgi:hypothetical protein
MSDVTLAAHPNPYKLYADDPLRRKFHNLANKFRAKPNPATTVNTLNTSYQCAGFISVSIKPLMVTVDPSESFVLDSRSWDAGNRPVLIYSSRNASFSIQRSRIHRSNSFASSRGISESANRRQYMFTDFGGLPSK